MAISRVHVWAAGEVLLATDLNSEFNSILTNAADLVSPFTKAISMGGFPLYFDAANTIAFTAATNGVSLTGGALNTPQGADIVAAATLNLDTATGNSPDVTGNTGITAVTLSVGRWRLVRFTGTPTITNGASLVVEGGADYTAVAGQYVLFIGYAGSVVRCIPFTTPAATQALTNKTLTNPANTVQALTDAATISWDTSLGAIGTVTLGGSRTMAAPTNLKAGGDYWLLITQDGTGGRTLTWNAVFKGWGGGTMTQPETTIAAVTLLAFKSDGTNLYTQQTTPFIDTNYIVRGSADPTKKVRIEVDGLTTASTRVITPPDQDLKLIALAGICEGRLTLTSGTAVTTSDVTAATTVYFTPYSGDRIATYDGTQWNVATFTEKSVSVPATTTTPFDVFIVDSTLALETVNWTNDTTRATAITLQNGVYVKSGTTTRRYLGTCRTTGSSGQTEDSLAKGFVWNYMNRVNRPMKVVDTTTSWAYSVAAFRQARATAANQLDYVQGVSEDAVQAQVVGGVSNDTATNDAQVGIGVDSTTVNSAQICTFGSTFLAAAPAKATIQAVYNGFPGIGRHVLVWLENPTSATGITTWYGGSASGFGSGIVGMRMG